jgi:RNA polymerase sigma-70 factor (ECF subfamily)
MEATEAVGGESQVGFNAGENGVREMEDILSRHLPRFYRSAYRQLGNAADAEDAVQEAMLAAFVHLHQFKGQAQMSTWLTAIVTNCARMQLRRRPRQLSVSLDERLGEDQDFCLADQLPAGEPSPEDQTRASELHRHLLRFVARLSPPLRRTFQLRELDGLSTSEAAAVLGVADGTVKAQLARARARLKKLMGGALRPKPRFSPAN